MKCINCYREIDDNMKFCNFCGAKQPLDRVAYEQDHPELADALSQDVLLQQEHERQIEEANRRAQEEAQRRAEEEVQHQVQENKKCIYCIYCGKSTSILFSFCPYCGQPLDALALRQLRQYQQ